MAEEGFKRKLTTILSADVVGYSCLMEDNEEATIQTLNIFRDSMSNLIQQHRGRVVDMTGDNLMAEFSSVVDAVKCAVETQKEMSERNADLPENRRMLFRIGVNLGDIVEEDNRIYGDGVNIAARLEGLAEGGGICISGTVYDHVENKLDCKYDYLGEKKVKNIARPIRVYNLLMKHDSSSAVASEEKMAFPLPDKPSIAVLPFLNMSGDPEQEYFSDGISEQIITSLSKIPDLFVVARTSSFRYKDEKIDAKQIGRELGVHYLLEGTCQRSGEQVRITSQLIDAITGEHLWADRYDKDLKHIFAIQDAITKKIITEIQVNLTEGEWARVGARDTQNIAAYEKWLQANEAFRRVDEKSTILGRQFAKEAIALDPNYSAAYTALGFTHTLDVWYRWTDSPDTSLEKAFNLAKKALTLDDSENAHRLLSSIYLLRRQHEKAIAEAERAVELNPNGSLGIWTLADALRHAGRNEEAITAYKKAMRLSPYFPASFLYGLARSYFFTGQYEKGIELSKQAIQRAPNFISAHLSLTVNLVALGRDEEARGEVEEIYKLNPKFSLDYITKTYPIKKQAEMELFINTLRKAGMK